jgi:CHAT domain-containing protein
MSSNHDDQLTITGYLLGALDEDRRNKFEQRFLTNDGVFEELLAAEDELIDQYLAGELNKEETEMFESNFLATGERKEKLRFAKALKKYATMHASNDLQRETETARTVPARAAAQSWWQFFSTSPWAVAAVAAVVLLAGLGVWRIYFYQSEVDKGILALNAAYREQRPLEARITQLNYAPYVTTRGDQPTRVNARELERAERILLDALHDQPGASAFHALGKFYLANRQFDQAIAQFEEALKADPSNAQINADLGAALLEKGKAELEQGKSEKGSLEAGKALEDLGRSVEYLKKALTLNPQLVEAIFNLALCYEQIFLPEQATETWNKYLEKDSTSGWADEARRKLKLLEEQKKKTAETKDNLLNEFLVAYEKRDSDGAWQALKLSRGRAGNLIVESLLDDYLNFAIAKRGKEAADTLQRIVYVGNVEQQTVGDRFVSDIARVYSLADPQHVRALSVARSQMKAANVRFNKGEFEDALALYTQARDSFVQNANDPEARFAETWIGYCRLRIPQVEESIQLFERLSATFESRRYKSLLAQSLHALADAHSSLNEFSRALDYAARGLKVANEEQDFATAIRCLTLAVSMNLILGDYRQSLDCLNDAITLVAKISPEPKLTWPLYHEAAIDFHFLDLPASALAFEQEALRLANAAKVPLLRSRSWERMGIIYGQQKNYPEAINSAEKALAEAQNIAGSLSRKNVLARSMLTLGELNRQAGEWQKGIAYFDQAIAIYKDLNFEAYSYEAHKGKLLALLALNDNAAASSELNTVLALFEANRKRITEESNRDKFFDVGQDTYDLAIDFASSRSQDDRQAVQYAEASRARSLFEMMKTQVSLVENDNGPEIKLASETRPLTVSEIQQSMPAETQLLEYAVLDDHVLMWVITKSSVRSGRYQISAADLKNKVQRYVGFLSGSVSETFAVTVKVAKELHDILIAPIEGLLDSKLQLCILPDKNLNYLPFGALVSSSSGHYLIEDYELELAPSATVFIRCSEEARKRTNLASERLLVVGNPRFDQSKFKNLRDLPGAEREAGQIASFYPSATQLLGQTAAEETVTRDLKRADVVHLATHALVDARSPLSSKLLLAQEGESTHATKDRDGVLEAAEIYQLKLPRARLVVLSACETGIELAYRGEGAIGLARPFIAAGVPLVVASLWPVDSDVTADLMISFHKHRTLDHMPTAEALRRAQLESFHNSQPSLKSNYGWAAFTVIGGYAAF